jgi:DNA-binding response OmpR family regulator
MPTADRAPHASEPSLASTARLMRVAQLAKEIIAIVSETPGLISSSSASATSLARVGSVAETDGRRRPIIDGATFCVHWDGRTCRLGNTLAFRLLERLARRPNQLVPCDVLLDELWDGYSSRDAVRSMVRVLRRKLCAAGMEDLALAIDGSTTHHYGLMLAGQF